MDLAVIPECFVDTNLLETLVPPATHYNHQKGCGTVAKVMKQNFADRFAVGIIDKDKNEVDYLKEFTVVCKAGSLILHRHSNPAKHHYIIQINPAMERFIMDNAVSVNISLSDFHLPEDLNQLRKESKLVTTKNDARFKRLFSAMCDAGAADLTRLAGWVSYLKENMYKTDVEVLKGI